MARLRNLTDAELPDDLREQAEQSDDSGIFTSLIRVLGHRPDMIRAYFNFYYPMHNGGAVDVTLKELVRLRIAQLNQCLT